LKPAQRHDSFSIQREKEKHGYANILKFSASCLDHLAGNLTLENPLAIELLSVIIRVVTAAGTRSVQVSKSRPFKLLIMKILTIIRAGDIAFLG
jgi:hypothetical protein